MAVVRAAVLACMVIAGWFSSQTVYLMTEAPAIVFQAVNSGAITVTG